MKPKTTQAPRAPMPKPVYTKYRPDRATRAAQERARRDQPPFISMASSTPNIKLSED